MLCFVYRSRRKPDTYLYLSSRDGFQALPDALLGAIGEAEFVMDLVLWPQRTLAQEDAVQVLKNLLQRGFHVQLPPPDARLPFPAAH